MPGDLEQLRRTIEDGVRAAEQLQKLLAEEKRKRRPKLKLIKGGLIGAAIWAGVEWFRDYRRSAGALAFSGLVVTGIGITELPESPGSDPPEVIKPPVSVRPSVPVRLDATPTPPRPPRTSPLRTTPAPAAAPAAAQPAKTPTPVATTAPTKEVAVEVTVPTLLPSTTLTPASVSPAQTCKVDLLGVKLCLPRGRS